MGGVTGHALTRHICVVQFVHWRAPKTQCAWLKTKRDVQASLCPKISFRHLMLSHISSMVVLSRAVLHHDE